jgi:hypothetical protein
MQPGHLSVSKSLRLAFAASLLLHAAILFITYKVPDTESGHSLNPESTDNSTDAARPRLQARLASPSAPPAAPREAAPESTPRKPAESSGKSSKQAKLNAPKGVWANRAFSKAERADMDKFLNELATQAKPPTGRELSQKALAMARQSGRVAQEGEEEGVGQAPVGGKVVEPYSLEMYFDAFVRKMNRSAAFVKNDPRTRGQRKALVEISLNPDGSLKNYRVLRSGDQEAEIAYIKSVVDRASPFSAFPPDIRKSMNALTITMCIYPAGQGGGGFSRSFGDQDCKD